MKNEKEKTDSKYSKTKSCDKKHTHAYDFEDGVQVTEEDIAEWHKKVLDSLIEDKEKNVSYIRSGNGIVFGRKNKETGGIEIFEIKNGYKYYDYQDGV